MKYQIGEIIYHNLTDEEFIVIEYRVGKEYKCRNRHYQTFIFKESEIRCRNIN